MPNNFRKFIKLPFRTPFATRLSNLCTFTWLRVTCSCLVCCVLPARFNQNNRTSTQTRRPTPFFIAAIVCLCWPMKSRPQRLAFANDSQARVAQQTIAPVRRPAKANKRHKPLLRRRLRQQQCPQAPLLRCIVARLATIDADCGVVRLLHNSKGAAIAAPAI